MPSDFVDLRKSPIDLHDIEKNVREFYNCLDISEDEDIKTQCLDARSFLDSARLLLRNLISVEENSLIGRFGKAYSFMQENLGRVDKRLNIVEEENIGGLQVHENYTGKKIMDSPFIRRYMNSLINCMEHLVYYPIKNALKKYRETEETDDGKKIIKDKNLFLYFVFLELLHSSESLGSVTAERNTGKKTTVAPVHESDNDENYSHKSDAPPSLPDNIPTESSVSNPGQSAEDFFRDPVDKEGVGEKKIFEDDDMEIVEDLEDED